MLNSVPRLGVSDLIHLEWGLNFGIFQKLPSDVNVQSRLKVIALDTCSCGLPCRKTMPHRKSSQGQEVRSKEDSGKI
jgi:hypothetical protein